MFGNHLVMRIARQGARRSAVISRAFLRLGNIVIDKVAALDPHMRQSNLAVGRHLDDAIIATRVTLHRQLVGSGAIDHVSVLIMRVHRADSENARVPKLRPEFGQVPSQIRIVGLRQYACDESQQLFERVKSHASG